MWRIIRLSRSPLALQQFDNPELQNAPASWPYDSRALGVLHLGIGGSSDLLAYPGKLQPEFLLSFSIGVVSLH